MKKQFNLYMNENTIECFDIIRNRYDKLSGLSNSQIAEICIKCFCDNYSPEDYYNFYKRYVLRED